MKRLSTFIVQTLRRFFAEAAIEPCTVLVATSGGVDSTALLLGASELRADGFTIRAAHVNHHLRGPESDADEAFVRELCARLGVPLDVADGTLDDERVRRRGVEAAAREVRYQRLNEIRGDTHFIATAHQKDDQAETVLMRLLTGSGIAGLRGIHPIRDDGFIRPLLDVTRAELEAYLRDRGITPRFDRSNDDPRFLRNRVRVLVRELGATDNLAAVAVQARAQWPLLERAIDEAERAHANVGEQETRFASWPDDPWLRSALLQRHIRRLDPEARDFDAHRIANELASIRRTSITKTLELVRQGETLVLRKRPEETPQFEIELSEDAPAYIPEIGKTVHLAPRRTQSGSKAETLGAAVRAAGLGRQTLPAVPAQLFQLPDDAIATFLVRNRRTGDRFHPLGMPSAKKLKDFLIDRKIPAEVRDRLPLLLCNDEIVWVAGVEISERFKVTASGGAIYEVSMEDSGAPNHDDHSGLRR